MALTHRLGSNFPHMALPRSVKLDILSRDAEQVDSGWGRQRARSLAATGSTCHVSMSAKMGALEPAVTGALFTCPGPGTGKTIQSTKYMFAE